MKQRYPSEYEVWKVFCTIVCKALNADPKDRVGIAEAEAKERFGQMYSNMPERVANTALRLVAWMENWHDAG